MTQSTRPRSTTPSRRSPRGPLTRSLPCASCGAAIDDRSALRILRNDDLPPECDAVEFVHEPCAAAFVSGSTDSWSIYTADSPEAAWFLPVMIQWR